MKANIIASALIRLAGDLRNTGTDYYLAPSTDAGTLYGIQMGPFEKWTPDSLIALADEVLSKTGVIEELLSAVEVRQ